MPETRSSPPLELGDLVGDLLGGEQSSGVHWPPNVFAITARALKLTGAYRHATSVNSADPWPPDAQWIGRIENEGALWWEWLLDTDSSIEFEHLTILKESLSVLESCKDTRLDDFSLIGTQSTPTASGKNGSSEEPTVPERISRALLSLHALADQACRGVGVLSGKGGHLAIAHLIANSLLAETGSLATLPRSEGVVLPKLRTPQVGLTLRSFSHHLTYHQSETQVIWRSLPWANIDENTLNLLVVPWPSHVRAVDFKPRLTLGKARSLGRARFFAYSPVAPFDPMMVVRYLRAAREHCERIHVVALPELALWHDELNDLKDALVSHFAPSRIPLILTGVASRPDARRDGDSDAPSTDPHRNRVILSAYFAGDWYELDQDKHHRWRIDDDQIQQYGLGGTLTGGTEWWEAIEIHNRKISFLVPNGWLALTPLICEDLARLEPVSDLVRGVGPTLVVALLFDGPQLKQRWSARYASVLADDPGSAVLNLTSLGMAGRSRIMAGSTTETADSLGNRNVALWRDHENDWHEIELPAGSNDAKPHGAALLTVTAHWKTEYTADGRDDDGQAALFVLEGVHTLEALDSSGKKEQTEDQRPLYPDQLKGSDPLEITLSTYLADALLDSLPAQRDTIISWAMLDSERPFEESIGRLPIEELQDRLFARSQLRGRASDSDQDGQGTSEHLSPEYRWAARELQRRLAGFPPSQEQTSRIPQREQPNGKSEDRERSTSRQALRKRYAAIVRDCREHLDMMDPERELPPLPTIDDIPVEPAARARRVHIEVSLLLLWAVHKRISQRRRAGLFSSHWADLLRQVEHELERPMDEWIYEAIHAVRENEASEGEGPPPAKLHQ